MSDGDERQDIDAILKTLKLHDLQFAQLKDMHNQGTSTITQFMSYTNKTLNLHQEAIGILAAGLKKLKEKGLI